MKEKPPIPPFLVLALGILAVSTASVFIRFAQAEASSLAIAAFRLTFATLILSPLALTRYRHELAKLTRREIGLALLSGIFLAFHFATWITSLEYTTVASSVVLVSTTPLWVALLAPLIINEKINRSVLLGMGLAFVGGGIIGLSDSCTIVGGRVVCPTLSSFIQGQAFLGDLLALAGAFMGACYLIIGRRLRNRMSLISYVYVVYGMAAVVLVGLMLLQRENPFRFSPIIYGWFLLLALVPQLLGHSTFNWALRYLSTSYVSISLLGEPVGSTILAYLFLRETPTYLKLIGAILILCGIYLTARSDVSPKSSPVSPPVSPAQE